MLLLLLMLLFDSVSLTASTLASMTSSINSTVVISKQILIVPFKLFMTPPLPCAIPHTVCTDLFLYNIYSSDNFIDIFSVFLRHL